MGSARIILLGLIGILSCVDKNVKTTHPPAVDSVRTINPLQNISIADLDARSETSIVLGDYEGAAKYLQEIIRRDSVNGKAFFHLGRCYGRLRRVEEAKQMHLRAFHLGYQQTTQCCYIATYFFEQGNLDSCKFYLDKALKIDPEDRPTLLLDRLYFPKKPKSNV
jgi:tetratricopeptide (TPR) repeat protein